MSIQLGTLLRIDPREVWVHEASRFTPWLADNLDQLARVLGMDLELIRREASVGDFSADLVARDLNRDCVVIIENQLEATDHRHLGQLITYAAGLDAGAVVWVSPQLREEHRQALDWLNRRSESTLEFFGVALELIKVDESLPAVNFRLAAFPNNWGRHTKETSEKTDGLSDRRTAYQAFFQQLIDQLREEHHFTNQRVAQPDNWAHFSAGVTGIRYGVTFSSSGLRTELYIDANDASLNTAIFRALAGQRESIEQELGFSLSWEALEGRRACRIATYREGSSLTEIDRETLLAWTVDMLLKFRSVFGPKLRAAVAAAEQVSSGDDRTQGAITFAA
ncbi:MAG: DUF4268 domain-containing protein [Geminicoccaceae bacterium]